MNCSWLARSALLGIALFSTAALAETEETLHKTLPASPGGNLVIEVDFGSIEVKTNATAEVVIDVSRKVTRSSKAKEEEFLRERPVVIAEQNGTVSIRSRGKQNVSSGWKNRNEGRYTVSVPAHYKADLRTSGGGIDVSGLRADLRTHTSGGHLRFRDLVGNLDGHTSGGGINAEACQGKLNLDTSGGHIEVKKSAGTLNGDTSGGHVKVTGFDGPVSVGTSGGHITLEDITGKVDGSTSGGSVRAVMVRVPEHIKLSTSGGHVVVVVPEQAAFELNAETSAGQVRCELPIKSAGKPTRDKLAGPVNGGGPLVHLRSSGGNIEVKKR